MRVEIFEHAADLPVMGGDSFFHSRQLMQLCEATPRHEPYMLVAYDDGDTPVGHLLAIGRTHRLWFPPYRYRHVRVYGEGDYAAGQTDECFGLMVGALTDMLRGSVLYIEFSHLSHKMLGYRHLREHNYFPVRWMNIHNSLHSRSPQERISQRRMKHVETGIQRGLTTKTVESEQEFSAAMRLLRRHLWLKPRRYLPDEELFRGMMREGCCDILVTSHRDRLVGCCVLVYSNGDAYLWFSASRRKSFAPLHPNAVTFWQAICHAYGKGCAHIRFMDVGLPFRKNPYRDFILSYGGKEVSCYRWFRISIRWVNRLASWLWRE